MKIHEGMTPWEREQAKRWQFLCGRKDFTKLKQISKDTYICSLHFVGSKGPTEEDPEPFLATLSAEECTKRLARKRKKPREWGEVQSKRHKKNFTCDEHHASKHEEKSQTLSENAFEDTELSFKNEQST